MAVVSVVAASGIRENESLSLFPSYAVRDGDRWRLRIHGWVYLRAQRWRWRRWFIAWLQRGLRIGPREESSAILQDRLTPFLVNGGGGRRLVIRIGQSEHEMPESSETGHFQGTIEIDADEFADVEPNGWTSFEVPGESSTFDGRVQLVEPEGLTVVSDLDDTIKDSNVRVRRELLANTFLRPFAAVPGMADWYSGWQEEGAVFHYVSNSPWQLTPMLGGFLETEGFPRGSMHLRPFRIRRGGLRRFLRASEAFKRTTLEQLLEDFPRRRFVLIGDSSELDPEIYGDLVREHPERIERVLVRNVTGEQADDERFAIAFADVPRDRWELFHDPAALRSGSSVG